MAKSAKSRGKNRTRDREFGAGPRGDRLADFETRLERARGRRGEAPEAGARGNAMGTAFRISSELVVGLVVGGLIGWQIDRWLDTLPVFLLLFFILGAAAGIWNVIRSALAMQSDTGQSDTGQSETGQSETGQSKTGDMQTATKIPERGPDAK